MKPEGVLSATAWIVVSQAGCNLIPAKIPHVFLPFLDQPAMPTQNICMSIQYTSHYYRYDSEGFPMAHSSTRTAPINLRALDSQRSLIDRAAALLGKNRSDFMLETACREAENVLLDQRLFLLDQANFDAFNQALNTPVKDNPALRKLMTRKSPWE